MNQLYHSVPATVWPKQAAAVISILAPRQPERGLVASTRELATDGLPGCVRSEKKQRKTDFLPEVTAHHKQFHFLQDSGTMDNRAQ